MTATKALLFGGRRERAIGLVVGFSVAVAAVTAATLVASAVDLRPLETLSSRTLPVLVVHAPAPIAAVGAYARCGGPACLAVGVIPVVVLGSFLAVTGAIGAPGVDGSAWVAELTGSFLIRGVSSAFVGFCAGVTTALLADLVGFGSGS
ncbi:hypothetical protein DQW50_16950 [Halorubrum sp. 48-1-W]|uniref:hypothetical protein n=1 Tax=Halorubrum sp. 48-1-W TaxID=2249761 RepID=UPI000DCBA249|nr:hypothetical protein [Halorubrum sp. 48-1-W]RAW43945.1 hypothetical protein DQW50_16950 [Halorubrum sp. 48-1-W]